MNEALTPFSFSLFVLLLLASVSSSAAQAVSTSPEQKTREKTAVSFEKAASANNGKKNRGPIARSTNTEGLARSQRANNSTGRLTGRPLDESAVAAQKYYETGLSLQSSGKYEEAVVAFKQAIKLVREHAQAHYGLGMAYHSLKDYKRAGESFKLAVQFAPDWPEAHFKLGLVSYVVGRMSVAVEEYKTLLKLNSSLAHLLERVIRVENSNLRVVKSASESSPATQKTLPDSKLKESSNETVETNTDAAPNGSLSKLEPSVEISSLRVGKSPSQKPSVENTSLRVGKSPSQNAPAPQRILPDSRLKESPNETAKPNTVAARNESLSKLEPAVENSSLRVGKSPSESAPATQRILPDSKLKESPNETKPNTDPVPNGSLSIKPSVENSSLRVGKSPSESLPATPTEIAAGSKLKESSNETAKPNTVAAPGSLPKLEPSVENSSLHVGKSPSESLPVTQIEIPPGSKPKESPNQTVGPNAHAAANGSLSKLEPSVTEVVPVSQPSAATMTSKAVTEDSVLTGIYKVGVGDVLDIRLLNTPTARSTLYTVANGGVIDLPFAGGPIAVVGLTTDEIQTRITAELNRLALQERAQLSVGIRQYASHDVIITGLLNNPGTRFLRREAVPLYVIMAEAQLRPDAGRISIMRGGVSQVLDLNDPVALNFIVKSGDVINVTARPQEFYYVGGRIKFPGQKIFQSGITVLQAILAAGGVDRQSDNKVELSREAADGHLITSKYSLKEIKAGKIPDPKLKPGDRVEVFN